MKRRKLLKVERSEERIGRWIKMDWLSILKMPNPHGGRWADLTRDQYHKMDDKNKERYHHGMALGYAKQIKEAVTPRKAGQAPPATDDKIRELRELNRFHSRQRHRIRGRLGHSGIDKDSYYSLEDETNRRTMKPQYDAVERVPTTTKEMYDNYSRDEKKRYWARLNRQLFNEYGRSHPKVTLTDRMYSRMKTNPNYTPPFEGENQSRGDYMFAGIHRDVSEYDDFTNKEKRNYHARMSNKNKREGDMEGYRWHNKMGLRALGSPTGLLTYPTPEAEKEATQ